MRLGCRKKCWNYGTTKVCFFVTKQLDQANNIHKRVWVTQIELEEMNKKIQIDNGNRNKTDTDNVTPQETNTTTMSEKESSIEQLGETPNENQNAWYIIKEPFNEEGKKFFEVLVTPNSNIGWNHIPQREVWIKNVYLWQVLKLTLCLTK